MYYYPPYLRDGFIGGRLYANPTTPNNADSNNSFMLIRIHRINDFTKTNNHYKRDNIYKWLNLTRQVSRMGPFNLVHLHYSVISLTTFYLIENQDVFCVVPYLLSNIVLVFTLHSKFRLGLVCNVCTQCIITGNLHNQVLLKFISSLITKDS